MNTKPTKAHAALVTTGFLLCISWAVHAQRPVLITSFTRNGNLAWSDSGYADRLYTIEWSSDLTSWTNTWSHLRLQSVSVLANTVSVPMFYRVSAIRKDEDRLPPSAAQLVGKSLAIIGYDANLRVDIVTTTNGFFQGLDSSSPPRTAAQYVYQVLDRTNAFLRVAWPGMTIEGQMHFYTRSAGTLDRSLGKGFFILE